MDIDEPLSDKEQEYIDDCLLEEPLSDEEEEGLAELMDLEARERWYRAQPNNHRMLELWSKYNLYKRPMPGWLQGKVDAYLMAQLRHERGRYSLGNMSRDLKHILEVEQAKQDAKQRGANPANAERKAIERIAKREGKTPDAIRARMRPKKKKKKEKS